MLKLESSEVHNKRCTNIKSFKIPLSTSFKTVQKCQKTKLMMQNPHDKLNDTAKWLQAKP